MSKDNKPPQEEKRQVLVSLTTEQYATLEEQAKTEMRSVSNLVAFKLMSLLKPQEA